LQLLLLLLLLSTKNWLLEAKKKYLEHLGETSLDVEGGDLGGGSRLLGGDQVGGGSESHCWLSGGWWREGGETKRRRKKNEKRRPAVEINERAKGVISHSPVKQTKKNMGKKVFLGL
jgi:hypothetical protein